MCLRRRARNDDREARDEESKSGQHLPGPRCVAKAVARDIDRDHVKPSRAKVAQTSKGTNGNRLVQTCGEMLRTQVRWSQAIEDVDVPRFALHRKVDALAVSRPT